MEFALLPEEDRALLNVLEATPPAVVHHVTCTPFSSWTEGRPPSGAGQITLKVRSGNTRLRRSSVIASSPPYGATTSTTQRRPPAVHSPPRGPPPRLPTPPSASPARTPPEPNATRH